MQTISGIHYNWSIPGVGTDGYLGGIRNFRREGWLLLYLFGASPALCQSFVAGREHGLERLSGSTLYRRTPSRCAWGGWATRAMPRPASR